MYITDPDYNIFYDFQYNIFPRLIFEYKDEIINQMIQDEDLIFDYFYNVFYDNDIDFSYTSDDFKITHKKLGTGSFNLIKINFNFEKRGILSPIVYIAYSDSFKKLKYYTIEWDDMLNEPDKIFFCETSKNGRRNLGKRDFDENAIEEEIKTRMGVKK